MRLSSRALFALMLIGLSLGGQLPAGETVASAAPRVAAAPAPFTVPVTAETPNRTYGAWHSAALGGGGYLQQVCWAPSDPRRMYVSSDVGGLWRSDDGGQRWGMLHGALPAEAASYSIRGLAVDPTDADRLLVAADSGIWLTTDAGRSFRLVQKLSLRGNGEFRWDGRVLLHAPSDANIVYAAGMNDGLFVSTDRGQSWTRIGPEGINPVDLCVDRADARKLWLCAAPLKKSWNNPHDLRGGVFASEDGGANWQEVAGVNLHEIRQSPWDRQTLFGLDPKLQAMRSQDGGKTWSRFSDGLAPREKGSDRTDGVYQAIDIGPDFVLLGSTGGNFYRLGATDASWQKVFTRDPARVEEGEWWGSLKRTYPHFGSALGWVQISPHNPAHWAFTDWYALYRSDDAGQHWRLTIDGIEMTVVHCLAQDPGNPRTVHTGVADVGYFRSEDGGMNYRQGGEGISNNVKHITLCPARPQRLYATGPQTWNWFANQLFVSDDGGKHWKRPAQKNLPDLKNRRCNTVAVHPRNPDEIYLTISGKIEKNGGGVWKSLDAGESFVWLGEGLPAQPKFFRTDIWVSGPEIAASADGTLVCISVDTGAAAFFDPQAGRWQPIGFKGGLNAVAADPLRPGRFWAARKENGLWRSDNGGRDWTQAAKEPAEHLAVDQSRAGRVAFNGQDGIRVSNDDGANWRKLPDTLPYRHPRNVLAFCGERLIAGTGGNGLFWIDLPSGGTR